MLLLESQNVSRRRQRHSRTEAPPSSKHHAVGVGANGKCLSVAGPGKLSSGRGIGPETGVLTARRGPHTSMAGATSFCSSGSQANRSHPRAVSQEHNRHASRTKLTELTSRNLDPNVFVCFSNEAGLIAFRGIGKRDRGRPWARTPPASFLSLPLSAATQSPPSSRPALPSRESLGAPPSTSQVLPPHVLLPLLPPLPPPPPPATFSEGPESWVAELSKDPPLTKATGGRSGGEISGTESPIAERAASAAVDRASAGTMGLRKDPGVCAQRPKNRVRVWEVAEIQRNTRSL